MSVIVYSVNTGNYDDLRTPTYYDPNVRYILFTDNKYFKSDIWEIYHTDFLNWLPDKRRIARYIKINSHLILPNHDISIWIDHCYPPKFNDVNLMFNKIGLSNNEIMCFKHDVRNCIYDESKVVKSMNLDYPILIDKQINRYISENFPPKLGLFDSGFMIRRNNDNVSKFNSIWWDEVNNNSARDQLSQVYSSWKSNVPIHPIQRGVSIYNNEFLYPKIKHPKKWLSSE